MRMLAVVSFLARQGFSGERIVRRDIAAWLAGRA